MSRARATPESAVGPGRWFLDGAADHRTRAADLAWGLAALLGTGLLVAVGRPPSRLEAAAIRLLAAGPTLLQDLWLVLAVLPAIAALALLLGAARDRRLDVLSSIALAGGIGVAGAVACARSDPGATVWWPLLAFDPVRSSPWCPPPELLVPAAMLLGARSHVIEPIRRGTTALVGLGCGAALALGVARPTGALAAVLIAVFASRATAAVLGSPSGRPDRDQVAVDLARVGFHANGLTPQGFAVSGAARFHAEDREGRPVIVDVLGRDDRDARLALSILRRLWYRSTGDPIVVGRFGQLQHRALQTLLASEAGASAERVLRVARAANGDAILVSRLAGTPLAVSDPDAGPALAGRVWAAMERLHGAGLAHGRVDAEHLTDDGVVVGLIGFEASSSAPAPERLRLDEAQALVTTALLLGVGPSVVAARTALGPDRLAAIVSFLQPAVLTAAQRRARSASKLDLAVLRAEAAAASDVEEPMLAPLRRVKVISAAQILLMPVALFGLWSMVGEFDLGGLADQVAAASWALIAVAAVVAQLSRVAQAFSTQGASPVRMPLGPLYALQLAVGYVNVVIPGGAARVAVNVRFFQRQGLPSGSALAIGALDGVSGLLVQMVVVPALLVLGSTNLDLDLDLAPRGDMGMLLLTLAGLVLAVALVLAGVPRLRRTVFGWARQAIGDAMGVLRGLRDPRRLALLVGGNLLSDLAIAFALAATVRAFGYAVPLGELWLITMTVALLAWIIPVPGGIGVSETGLLIGLTGAGLPEEAAFASMVVHRLLTFYLPPIWGFFALRWLTRHEYV